jgi:hypothetical protein
MPLSSYTVIPEVAYELSKRKGKIKTVLDIGIGFGMYGMVVRNYLDEGVQPFQVLLHEAQGNSEFMDKKRYSKQYAIITL